MIGRLEDCYKTVGQLAEIQEQVEPALKAEVTYHLAEFELSVTRDFLKAEAMLREVIRECERSYIQQSLQRCHGKIAQTAAYLGISRKNLWEKMKRLQIAARTAEGEDA